MDWTLAIDRNREVLMRLVGVLFALAGLVPGRAVALLPRQVRGRVMRDLRASESATRRLIVIQLSRMAKTIREALPRPIQPFPTGGVPEGTGAKIPAFRLIDSHKRFEWLTPRRARRKGAIAEPRIRSFDEDWSADPAPALPPEPSPDDPVDAARLCRRLLALKGALDDLPKQARRMARLRARRALNPPGPGRAGPMRPGLPPGYRIRQRDEIDQVLHDCHMLALHALNPPNTS